jgi:hypothetical protein
MSKIDIISIVESSMHPNYSGLYARKGLHETKVNSIRKAINLIKKEALRYIVAEFFYAYSTNYSGVHKSNLDVLPGPHEFKKICSTNTSYSIFG